MENENNTNSFLEKSLKVYSGDRFDVHAIEVKGASGKAIRREAVVHPGAAVVLPILEDERIVLIRNERFAVDQTLWELPAGTLEDDEPPEVTAKRELLEETGYDCEDLNLMMTFYTTPGYCNEIMYAFTARGLSFMGQELEELEKIDVEILTWNEVLELIRRGMIHDGKTLAALLFYHTFKPV